MIVYCTRTMSAIAKPASASVRAMVAKAARAWSTAASGIDIVA